MKRITAVELAIIVVAGLVPLLWFKPGFMIAHGDDFPIFLNAQKTLSSATNMWSLDYLGYATPNPSYLLYQLFGASLSILGLSTGFIQILIQVLLNITAGLSMYYFARIIYPGHERAPIFAAFFYMFNFFIMNFWLNLGFGWLYAFVPLLLGLFVSSVNAAYKQAKKSCYLYVFGFSLFSVVALSVASINPANVVLFILAFAVMGFYLLVKNIQNLKPLILTLAKILPLTILVNLWWIFPMLMAFILSPQGLNTQVNVAAWSWTHSRASFLNFFWLNGTWGWLPEYVPFFSYFNNPIVVVLAFVPFAVAGAALLFKGNKSRFNAYLMLCILSFLFFATGLHEKYVGDLNGFLYKNISLLSMFREPASKFTFLIMPFLALLIGFSCSKILTLQANIRPLKLKLTKALLLLFIVGSCLVVCAPIFNLDQFVRTRNNSLTYEPTQSNNSSYTQIPQYWYDTANWINNQPGDGKVLLTPLDDFYQINYTWGYYGSDQLMERFFNKPLLSTAALDGYVTNPNTFLNLRQVREAVKFNQKEEFKDLLDVLNVEYIVQRNDVITNNSGTDFVAQSVMGTFLNNQPYIQFMKSFGKLDIYEYTQAKSSISAILPSSLDKTNFYIDTTNILNETWGFSEQMPQGWLKTKTGDWENLSSPKLPTPIESTYDIDINFSTTNIATINNFNNTCISVTLSELDSNSNLLWRTNPPNIFVGWSNNTSYDIAVQFEPKNDSTHYFQIQFSNNASVGSHVSVSMNSISITGSVSTSHFVGIDNFFNANTVGERPIVRLTSESPTQIVVAVNSSEPFVLSVNQVLDRFWVASVNGQQIHPTTVYLGLKGFVINETGQFEIKIEYPPQQWFNYCLDVSGVTVLLMFVGVVYQQRISLQQFLQTLRSQIKR
jgi:hypothetical protein